MGTWAGGPLEVKRSPAMKAAPTPPGRNITRGLHSNAANDPYRKPHRPTPEQMTEAVMNTNLFLNIYIVMLRALKPFFH